MYLQASAPVLQIKKLHQPNSIRHNHLPICNVLMQYVLKLYSLFISFFYLIINRSLVTENLAEASYIFTGPACIHFTVFAKFAAHKVILRFNTCYLKMIGHKLYKYIS